MLDKMTGEFAAEMGQNSRSDPRYVSTDSMLLDLILSARGSTCFIKSCEESVAGK